MEENGFWTIVKNFLLSNINKQLFTFLFFLMLSAIFWLILTLNENYEKELGDGQYDILFCWVDWYKAQYHYTVTVKDATGATVTSQQIDMDW